MVQRLKHGPVNAATVLPPALVTALQQLSAGQHIYIPAIESPVARRWREARQAQQHGTSLPMIARQLGIAPRAVERLLTDRFISITGWRSRFGQFFRPQSF